MPKNAKKQPNTPPGITWTPVSIPLSKIKPWARNPKAISKSNAKRLLETWRELGQFQTVAVGPDGELYDGHQRLNVLLAAGESGTVHALQSSRPLTEQERERVVIAAHAGTVGEFDWQALAGWDTAQLGDWGLDAGTLAAWDSDAANLRAMLTAETDAGGEGDAEPQTDRAEELREKWQTERGQLWAIGAHRLLCGDSTSAEDLARVMGGDTCELVVTDPPYGVSYADKNAFLNSIDKGNKVQTEIENDHLTKEQTQELWRWAFANCYAAMSPGAVIYCFMPQGGDQMMMMMMMMESGIEPRHELIWLKNNHVLGRVDYAYKHEPILYAWKKGGHKFYGDFQTSVIECNRPNKSGMHPTMKPVELVEKLISNSSKAGGTVYEPFAGSGTTLVACENLGRVCRAIEISPAYVAVCLERLATAFPHIDIHRLD